MQLPRSTQPKLKGPHTWGHFHLYVIMDVYSRYVVGWMVADRESSTLAKRLIAETCCRQGIQEDQLTLHADRGSSMKSKPVALLLSDLGVTKSHSRPYVSDDNPFSESQFKTLKYCPNFPERFGSIQDARSFLVVFFHWYNEMHRHGGIALYTPYDVHHGLVSERHDHRAMVLRTAHQAHPERFVRGMPQPQVLPPAVWINKPREVESGAPEEAAEIVATEAPEVSGVAEKPAEVGQPRRSRTQANTPKPSRAAETVASTIDHQRPIAEPAGVVRLLH